MTDQLWLLIVSVLIALIGTLLLLGYNDVRGRLTSLARSTSQHHALVRKFLVKLIFLMPVDKQEDLLKEMGNLLIEKIGDDNERRF